MYLTRQKAKQLILLQKKDVWHNLCILTDFMDIWKISEYIHVRPLITSDTTVDGIVVLVYVCRCNMKTIVYPLELKTDVFSSPEPKAQGEVLWSLTVRRRRRRPSVRPSVRSQSLNNISSWTSDWILTKLHRNDPWLVLFQSCSNGSGPLHI